MVLESDSQFHQLKRSVFFQKLLEGQKEAIFFCLQMETIFKQKSELKRKITRFSNVLTILIRATKGTKR
jgi:hypothetical protein